MTYTLAIAARSFSSWSLRGWLMFEKFGIPVQPKMMGLYSGTFEQDLAEFAPARTVPAIRTPEGIVVGDTLAIAETLAERHPEADLWPADPATRAAARWLVAEMHSGFTALRSACPMNLRTAYTGFPVTDAIRADLARIEHLWAGAFNRFGGDWLCGDYSLADVFYAPVAFRMVAYGLPVSASALPYVERHLADPAFRRWRALALTETFATEPYAMDLDRAPWPGPSPLPARAVAAGPAENDRCPYSGKPVTDFLELDGRVFGFCNPTCRDKTVNDPEAWPAFMSIYQS